MDASAKVPALRYTGQLEWLMNQPDKGFGTYRRQIVKHEGIENIGDLWAKHCEIETRLGSIECNSLRESYTYLVCLGKYLALLEKENPSCGLDMIEV